MLYFLRHGSGPREMKGNVRNDGGSNRGRWLPVSDGMSNGIGNDAVEYRGGTERYKGHIITAANGVFRVPKPGHHVWINAFDSREAAMDCIDRLSGPQCGRQP